jgi:excisionase family DNA binding protein
MNTVCNDKFLTVAEVAEMLNVPVSWVYGRTRERGVQRIPHVKLGKYLRFDADAIRNWIENFQER